MADIIKIKRGEISQLPNLKDGELGYAYDTNELFIGTENGINKKPGQDTINNINTKLGEVDDKILDTIQDITDRGVNLKKLGAKGDGTTDDTQAIKSAFENGGYIVGGKATYKIKNPNILPITIPSGTVLDLRGTTFDFTGVPDTGTTITLFSASGTEGSKIPLITNATNGNYTVKVLDVNEFEIGDTVRLGSTLVYDSYSTNMTGGEILFISNIDKPNKIITFESVILGEYPILNNAYISKLTMAKDIKILGGTILGNPNQVQAIGVYTSLCEGVTIDGLKTRNINRCHIQYSDTIKSKIINCDISDANNPTTGYGTSVYNACQDILIHGNTYQRVRHSLSTNNSSTSDGIPRRIYFVNNNVLSSAINTSNGGGGDAVDTHTAADEIHIIGNSIFGSSGQGINFECRSGSIVDNLIIDAKSNGISVHNESDYIGNISIRGNKIRRVGGTGIIVTSGIRGSLVGYTTVTVSDNDVTTDTTAAITLGISSATNWAKSVLISGNQCSSANSVGSILVYGSNDTCTSGNVVKNTLTGNPIRYTNVTVGNVSSNMLTVGSNSQAAGVRLSGTTSDVGVFSNKVIYTGVSNSQRGVLFDDTTTNNYVTGNALGRLPGKAVIIGIGANNTEGINEGSKKSDFGNISTTTNATGIITIPHNLGVVPSFVSVSILGNNSYDAQVTSTSTVSIFVRIRNTNDNSNVVSTNVSVYWKAEV